MSFTATYSGLNSNSAPKSPWADIIPYISVDKNRTWTSSKISTEETISLNGQLTLSGFNALGSSPATYGYSSSPIVGLSFTSGYIQVFRDAFSRSYGELLVKNAGNNKVVSGIYYVDSIQFDSQNYIGVINYSVNLARINETTYSGLNPSETLSFSEDGNGIVNITHSISAEGVGPAFNGNNSIAFDSVKTFVQNSTGTARIKSLSFDSGFVPTGSGASGVYVSGGNSSNLILVSQTESINRMANKYSIDEVFKIDNIYNGEYGTKRFSVDFNSGIADEYNVVSVTCNIQGAKDKEFSGVTGMLSNITGQMYNAATGIYGSTTELCPIPIAFNIDTTRIITGYADGTNINGVNGSSSIIVNCSFDNSLNGTFFDYDISFSSDEQSNITSLDINGVIKGRGLHTAQKFYDASGYLFNTLLTNQADVGTMLFNKAVSGFNASAPTANTNLCFGVIGERSGQSFGFIKEKGQSNVDMNTNKGEITLSASFSDEAAVSGYNNFSWSTSAEVGMPLLVPKPSYKVNGFNLIQDIGVNQKTTYTFDGSFEFTTGSQGGIPILSASSRPHTGLLKKMVEAEGIASTEVSNQQEGNIGVVLENYNKNFDFVSGSNSNSNDYLGSGFNVNLSTPIQPLIVYSTYKVK
jgi:hypothetical protein